jgi:predicted MarR family transcription regulator
MADGMLSVRGVSKMKNNLQETQKTYLFAKQVLEAISDADRKDELAQMGRLLSIEEIQKIQYMVKAWEDQGIRRTIHRAD